MITVLHVDTERTWRGGEKQVFYLAMNLPDSEFQSIVAGPVKGALYDKAVSNGLKVLPLRSTREVSIRQYYDLKKAVVEHKVDIIHVHTSHGLVSAALVREKLKGKPKVVYSRRTDFHLRTGFLGISKKKYLWGADRILSVSDGIKNVLVDDGIPADKITTVYSGIDLSQSNLPERTGRLRREYDISPKTPLIGMVAALAPHKDPFNYLNAAEIVLKTNPEARFLLIGAGSLQNGLATAIQSKGMTRNFHLTGFRRDIPEILAELDVFCMSSSEEGLCTSILDAMSAELPVAATRAGGIPEAVSDNETGLLAPVSDSLALANHLITLINHPELRTQFGKAGRIRAEKMFDIRQTVQKTAEIYRSLVQ